LATAELKMKLDAQLVDRLHGLTNLGR
jgi:hypothetical protein